VDSAVLGCLGRHTIGCWRAAWHGEEEPIPGSCWRGYEERSTQSSRSAGELVEGLVCAADTGEAAVELGCSAGSGLKARASGNGEPVPI